MPLQQPRHESVWSATTQRPTLPRLVADTSADVCIVGAGIAGLTTGYLLSKAGRKVVVIDDGPIGSGQTEVTTAHLSNEIDDRYTEIERLHGAEGARLAAESHTAAIARIEQIVNEEHIDCDFQRLDGYLFKGPDQSAELIDAEFAAARRTGIVKVERVVRAPLGTFDTGPCLRFRDQGQFHPLKYLSHLVQAILKNGGAVYTETKALEIEGGNRARVTVSGPYTISASEIVVATNTPFNDRVAMHTKQAPYLSYVVGFRMPAGGVPRALYWDTLDPYHYVRVQPLHEGGNLSQETARTHELLIVGGEDHKTGQADDGELRFQRLEAWARERFPNIQNVVYRWAGQVLETMDGLAFIGRNPLDKDNVFIVTGDSGMGMTHGTIAGMLLTDLITGKDNPWIKLYDPHRKTVGAVAAFAKENLNVAAQFASWLTPGEFKSVDDLAPGCGGVVRRGLSKFAVHRDESGRVTELSAVCPHLGCVVAWNSAEQTWDCPCHGSRFDAQGKVLNGPANTDLAPAGELARASGDA